MATTQSHPRPTSKPPRGSINAAKPLEPDEIERARAMGARLAQEIALVLQQIPRTGASSLSLSRDLGIDRHICHRVCSALEFEHDWLEMLTRMPGIPSLRTLVEAAAAGTASVRVDEVMAAIEQFERFIWTTGGSQRQLNARLGATRNVIAVRHEHGLSDAVQPTGKAALFHSASQIIGAWADTLVLVSVMRPSASPGRIDGIAVMGYLGLRTNNTPFPLMPLSTSFTVAPGEKGLTPKISGLVVSSKDSEDEIPGLMTAFSSDPLPKITTRAMPGAMMRVIDAPLTDEKGIDLLFRTHMESGDPRNDPEPFQVIARRIRTPARHIIMDTFFHRSIRTSGIIRPSAVHPQWNVMASPQSSWQESLPGELRVELLGTGTEMTRTPRWARYQELCNTVFEASGWNPDEFIGWRCQSDFPYWGATYLMSFELVPETPS